MLFVISDIIRIFNFSFNLFILVCVNIAIIIHNLHINSIILSIYILDCVQ